MAVNRKWQNNSREDIKDGYILSQDKKKCINCVWNEWVALKQDKKINKGHRKLAKLSARQRDAHLRAVILDQLHQFQEQVELRRLQQPQMQKTGRFLLQVHALRNLQLKSTQKVHPRLRNHRFHGLAVDHRLWRLRQLNFQRSRHWGTGPVDWEPTEGIRRETNVPTIQGEDLYEERWRKRETHVRWQTSRAGYWKGDALEFAKNSKGHLLIWSIITPIYILWQLWPKWPCHQSRLRRIFLIINPKILADWWISLGW